MADDSAPKKDQGTLQSYHWWQPTIASVALGLFAIGLAIVAAGLLGLSEGIALKLIGGLATASGLVLGIAKDVLGSYTPNVAARRALASLALAGSVLLLVWVFRPGDPVRELTGDVNVGVATFAVRGHTQAMMDNDAFGHQFAKGLAKGIQQRGSATMPSGLTLEVGVVAQSAPAHQPGAGTGLEQWAIDVVRQTNSDFLLTGLIEFTSIGTEVLPYLYISPTRVPDSPELSGWYSPAVPIFAPSNISENTPALAETYSSISSSMVTLTRLGQTLERSELHRPSEVVDQLQLVLEEGDFHIVPKALIYLFLGNAQGRAACLEPTACQRDLLLAAETSYRTVLELDPASLRALVGLAEISLQQAQGDCGVTSRPDPVMLRQARAEFEDVLGAKSATPIVTAKASLGVSRVVTCQISAGLSNDDSEVVYIAAELRDAAKLNPDVSQIAAEAVALQGLTAELLDRPREAVKAFEIAVTLARDPTRKALWLGFLANVQGSHPICRINGSLAAYDEALRSYEKLISVAEGGHRNQLMLERGEVEARRKAVMAHGCQP
jgi:tetratricopeptide (TPR) repeat protein